MLLLSHAPGSVAFTPVLSLQIFLFKTLHLQLLHFIFLEKAHCFSLLRFSGLLLLPSVKLIIPVSFTSLADVASRLCRPIAVICKHAMWHRALAD